MEQIDNLSSLLSYFKSSQSLRALHDICQLNDLSMKMECSYDGSFEERLAYADSHRAKIRRVLLYCNGRQSPSKLAQQFTSVVINTKTYNYVSIAGKMIISNGSRKLIDHFYKNNECKIYPLQDGTVLNLHNFEGKWILSSSHGWDVSHYKWLSDKTFMELFVESIQKYHEFINKTGFEYNTLTKELSFTNLNPNISYTIGYHHNDVHPLQLDTIKAWFISAYDLQSTARVTIDLKLPTISALTDVSISYLYRNANNGLKNYLLTGHIEYGYIIKFSDKCMLPDMIIKSKLLQFIESKMYNIGKYRIICNSVPAKIRKECCALRGFLNIMDRDIFQKVFPQYIPVFEKYEIRVQHIIDIVASNFNTIKFDTKIIRPCELTDEIVAKLLIIGYKTHNGNECITHSLKSIMYDMLVNESHFELLIHLFYNIKEE